MAATIIKERYYILTPLSCQLGVLVLIATLLLAAASYLRSIDKTMACVDAWVMIVRLMVEVMAWSITCTGVILR